MERKIALEKATDILIKKKGVLLEFSLKANPRGKLFGSITSKNIVDKLLELDIHFDRKCLDLPLPLKEVGQYSIAVRLTDEIVETIRVEHFIEKYGKQNQKLPLELAADAKKILIHYHWRGNVRELENVMERAVILSDGKNITSENLLLFSENQK